MIKPFLPGIALANPIVKLSDSYNRLYLLYYPETPISNFIWYTEIYQVNNISYGSGGLVLGGSAITKQKFYTSRGTLILGGSAIAH